jgi:lysophospholipase L1-like esterase
MNIRDFWKKNRLWILLGFFILLVGIPVGIWIFTPKSDSTEYAVYWQDRSDTYVEANKTALTQQMVFIGDSLTDGFTLDTYLESDLMLYNRGISGDKTSGVLTRLQSNVLDIAPAIIVILIGANDIHGSVPPDTVIENIHQICQIIHDTLPTCRVYLESIYPTNDTSVANIEDFWDEISLCNIGIASVASEFGYQYINIHDSLLSGSEMNRSLSSDGVHLNEAGYRIVAAKLVEAIPELRIKA